MALELVKPEDDDDEGAQDRRPDESREQVHGDDQDEERVEPDTEEREDEQQEAVDDEPPARRRSPDYASENRELRERLARLEGQLSQPTARQPAPQPREPSDEEKASWTTQQHIQHELKKSEERNQTTLQQIQFQTLEAGDKAGWTSYCATDPRARKMSNAVEQRLQQLRAAGQWGWSRGDVYTRLVGERVIAQGRTSAETQRQEGAKRIARQTTRGASPAGDQPKRDRGNLTPQQARDQRLKDSGFFG